MLLWLFMYLVTFGVVFLFCDIYRLGYRSGCSGGDSSGVGVGLIFFYNGTKVA